MSSPPLERSEGKEDSLCRGTTAYRNIGSATVRIAYFVPYFNKNRSAQVGWVSAGLRIDNFTGNGYTKDTTKGTTDRRLSPGNYLKEITAGWGTGRLLLFINCDNAVDNADNDQCISQKLRPCDHRAAPPFRRNQRAKKPSEKRDNRLPRIGSATVRITYFAPDFNKNRSAQAGRFCYAVSS